MEAGIQIVTTADRRYVIPLAVLAKSLDINLRTCMPATLHVIDGGLGWRNRRKIERSLDPARVRVVWLPPPDRRELEGVPVFGHVNATAYYRLFVPRILSNVPKVIYLDADMLVLGDLGELWRLPMLGQPLMAVQDGRNAVVRCYPVDHFREMGLRGDAMVLNSGLLVMNLDAWRLGKFADAMLKYLRDHSHKVVFWDQDAINVVLLDRWTPLPFAWNTRVDCGESLELPNTKEYRASLERNARIVHFASALKPWHYGCEHPGKDLFSAYFRLTAFDGWRPRPPLRALRNIHFWGALIRQCPVLGPAWDRVRVVTRGTVEHQDMDR